MIRIEPGIYVNYKSDDKRYEVLGTGRNTETDEEYIIYRPLYEADDQPDFHVRPIAIFLGSVAVNGQTIPRFRKLDE